MFGQIHSVIAKQPTTIAVTASSWEKYGKFTYVLISQVLFSGTKSFFMGPDDFVIVEGL